MMRQSDIIMGALVLCFVVFITARGELSQYISVFLPTGSSSGGTSSGFSSGAASGADSQTFSGLLSAFGGFM